MTPDKAIKILKVYHYSMLGVASPGICNAIKLGISALKREKANRENPSYVLVGPLPGETEE